VVSHFFSAVAELEATLALFLKPEKKHWIFKLQSRNNYEE
jgi:hypothetical protein